jgi:hypothetical protein
MTRAFSFEADQTFNAKSVTCSAIVEPRHALVKRQVCVISNDSLPRYDPSLFSSKASRRASSLIPFIFNTFRLGDYAC